MVYIISHAMRVSAIFGLLLAVLAGCAGGSGAGVASAGLSSGAGSASGRRVLPAEFFSRKAIAYSGYRGTDHNTPPTAQQVQEDLRLLLQSGFSLIRLFDSGDEDAKVVLQTIREQHLDIKVQLGIWINGAKAAADAVNQAEIARGIALANAYPDLVLTVSVGNETMVDWSQLKVPPSDMAHYIQQVRGAIRQPVTTDDNWAFFANDGNKYQTRIITDVIDFASMHTYPLLDSVYLPSFEWKHIEVAPEARAAAMMDSMIGKAKADYRAIQTYFQAQGIAMPVTIGETGWKAFGSEQQRAHPANQKMYYDRLTAWTDGPQQIFYFEAFDEPWKGDDDGWGLFTVQRQARYALQARYPSLVTDGTHYTDADALYYVPSPTAQPVTARFYGLFAEALPADAAVPSDGVAWSAWDMPPTATGTLTAGDAAEGVQAMRIVPVPKDWGWGFFMGLAHVENLASFATTGSTLNFSIKTTYPGKLEVGFMTGRSADGSAVDAYVPIAPGDYGYQNDGRWHAVSIPVQAMVARAVPAFGQPGGARLDLQQVSAGFVLADRYALTGNAHGSGVPVLIDGIYWAHP